MEGVVFILDEDVADLKGMGKVGVGIREVNDEGGRVEGSTKIEGKGTCVEGLEVKKGFEIAGYEDGAGWGVGDGFRGFVAGIDAHGCAAFLEGAKRAWQV